MWIFSATLAYLVDSNPGRASSAVAMNSLFRGIMAASASQAAGPAVSAMGTGWFYTGASDSFYTASQIAVTDRSLLRFCRSHYRRRDFAARDESQGQRMAKQLHAAYF